ncbi:MAG: N-acetylglucosamine-6-phosphate deacetylase [Trueperaceae bacterium]
MIATRLPHGHPVRVDFDGGRLELTEADAPADEGVWVGPGWVDVQVNGFAGVDANDPATEPDAYARMTAALRARGVTRYLPTVITADLPRMAASLAAAVRACAAEPDVADAVAGLHLEGPFLSPEDGARGAHPAAHVRPADVAAFDDLQAAAGGRIRVLTLAPEVPGALELIAHAAGQGVVVALGHTNADAATIAAAVDAGARLSTHLGNGTAAMLPRHDNVIWTQLGEPRLTASAIFDGHHLPPAVMRVFAAVKGPERLVLTSDAVALAGMPPGIYRQPVGGEVELLASGRLTLRGTPYLAGSASSLADGVAHAVRDAGVAVEDAWAMVSTTPARLLGLEERGDLTLALVAPDGVRVLGTRVAGRAAAT